LKNCGIFCQYLWNRNTLLENLQIIRKCMFLSDQFSAHLPE